MPIGYVAKMFIAHRAVEAPRCRIGRNRRGFGDQIFCPERARIIFRRNLQTLRQSAPLRIRIHRDPIELETRIGCRDRTEANVTLEPRSAIREEKMVSALLGPLLQAFFDELARDRDLGRIEDASAADQRLNGVGVTRLRAAPKRAL